MSKPWDNEDSPLTDAAERHSDVPNMVPSDLCRDLENQARYYKKEAHALYVIADEMLTRIMNCNKCSEAWWHPKSPAGKWQRALSTKSHLAHTESSTETPQNQTRTRVKYERYI